MISHETYRHVRGVFDVSPLDPLTSKAERSLSRVRRASSQAPHVSDADHAGSRASRPHGRSRAGTRRPYERDWTSRWATVARGRSPVSAKPASASRDCCTSSRTGSNCCQQDVYFLKARALATRQKIPYGVFRDLVCIPLRDPRQRFPIDRWREASCRVRAPIWQPAEAVLVGHWLGFDLSSVDSVRQLQGSTAFVICR